MQSQITHQKFLGTMSEPGLSCYQKIVQHAGIASGNLYAVVDTRHSALQRHFSTWNVLQWRSIWDSLITNDCSDIAPYLLHIADVEHFGTAEHADAITDAHSLVARLIAGVDGKPMLTWLWSEKSFDELHQHLQDWAECQTADGQSILLHFYDNRILPGLLSVLTQDQKQAFIGVASAWWYADRDGQVHVVTRQGIVEPIALPIQLTADQEKDLLNVNSADAIISDINSISAELTDDQPYPVLHRAVEDLLKKAHSYHLVNYSDHLKFVMLGLMYGSEFDQHAQLQEQWKKLKDGKIAFSDIAELAHKIW